MSSLLSSTTSTSSSSSSSSASTISNGRYWGLASGLDVDSIVTALVSDKQTQIDKANQQKQTLEWKQSAYQSIISSMTAFQNTYLSVVGSSSILTSKNYVVYDAASNNTAVSVTAGSAAASGTHTLSVSKLASAASVSGSQINSSINSTAAAVTAGELYNTGFNITVDGVTKNIAIKSTDAITDGNGNVDYNLLAGVLQTDINNAMGGMDKVAVSGAGGKISISTSSSYESIISVSSAGDTITGSNAPVTTIAASDTMTDDEKTAAYKAALDGTDFQMTVNGTTKDISFSDGDDYSDLATLLQTKVNTAFNSGMVKVSLDGSKNIVFQSDGSSAPQISLADGTNSSLAQLGIKSGASVGDTLMALGITDQTGLSNRVDTTQSVATLFPSVQAASDGSFTVTVNGVDISLKTSDSLAEAFSAINSSGAGVNIGYSSTTGRVTMTATNTGAAYTADISSSNNAASGFFSALGLSSDNLQSGSDAVFNLDGVNYSRSSNNFSMNGISYSLNGTISSSSPATITMTSDTTNAVKGITDFVNAYNTLVSTINTQVTTKPDSDYTPLTDAQKKEMSDTDIANWNTKAQSGLLFSDPTLNSILSQMQSLVYQPVQTSDGKSLSLYQIGITLSTDYTDGGQLQVDTTKLTQALQNDPGAVQDLFTKMSGTAYSIDGSTGSQTTRMQQEGVGYRLQDIINNATEQGAYPYVGSLVAIAGTATDTSTNYELNKELASVNNQITDYEQQMTDKKNQLYNQFTQLETFMEEMNAQSSMLTSFSSGS